jgi:hypothetical protein
VRGRHRHKRAEAPLVERPRASKVRRSPKKGTPHRHILAGVAVRIRTAAGPALQEYSLHATKGFRSMRA